MIHVILALIFYPKIIHDEGEGKWPRFMFPKARRFNAFIISERCKFSPEPFIHQNSHLW